MTCPDCGGKGVVNKTQTSLFGQIMTRVTCSTCGGKGYTFKTKCKTCGGKGRYKQRKTYTVEVPKGVDTGDRIRMSGKGEPGKMVELMETYILSLQFQIVLYIKEKRTTCIWTYQLLLLNLF